MEEQLTAPVRIRFQYCLLTINSEMLSSKRDIKVDFGESNSAFVKNNDVVVQQTLKVSNLHNLIDALNYMALIGWEVEHLMPYDVRYSQTLSRNITKSDDLRYLMKRQV